MDNARFRLLVVDDERGLCAGVQEALRREGYLVDGANDARTALELLGAHSYQVVLTDVRMPEMSGLQLLQQARQAHADTQFIVMTAYGTVENAVEAMKAGAYDYVTKPLDMQRLRLLVAKALEFRNVVAENNELRQRLRKKAEPGLLIGESEPMRRVLETAQEVARSDVTVLIEGESGTGKELVARTIHQHSARAGKPFISVNCAAFAEQLLEGELFGHVKGAFTGAVTTKPGRFQLADGGTLFLDEIGDLPAKGQGDLLRVLEDGAFRMVGGTELIRVDVRIVAATNKRLQEAVTAGRFREDLFYRLQVVPIVVPPLRERAEDIPLLVESFLDHFSSKHKRRRKKLSAEAMQLCRRFPWPGNVRQLRNVVERLVVTCAGSTIEVRDLPDFLQEHDRQAPACEIRPGMTLAECEKLLIRQTLTHATANREQAARLLGISRRALQYKLKSYGLLPAKREPVPPTSVPELNGDGKGAVD
ncbi:sigma-54 dependent transcriptional regulator [Opitutus sp. ER46]|uniref:sigma-54-dependent transcriptional regulator n=1 Tax=Opitutus sp. ER46 TaxID=2161864 RepID=UPI000D2FF30D|nr:sigma-54 dependent transcriptional regulator [Opitutus sp. ER46]PTX94584.1 transcriptional regulator [Opitutus sp. ER46]